MKVAHRDDYDTHAVIGGNNVQEFAIAQTAEFFTVLSNTLYSNKPLAVIREVLCNAWDAQIVSGRTDRPVIIKIDEDKLSIRDYGHGIPHELIHQIYCVYGNSTKENDGNQTGGFGLGSKSPFAYSDHFTVMNHYDGIKTVHAISRGSTLTNGKPDRRVMVTVPTTETGVEVIIPVKNREDMKQFISIAMDIAAFGEMNVQINGDQVAVVPISTGEKNLFLTTRKPRGSFNPINIRYGNVVYPVQPDAEYIGAYTRLQKILKDIPSRHRLHDNDFVLILQAPPNSISVTPSREALSNTETTVKTIKKLFNEIINFIQTGNAEFEQRLLIEQEKAFEHMRVKGYMDRVFFSQNLLSDRFGPETINDGRSVWTEINSMVSLADYYLRYKEKISDKMKVKLTTQRVKMLVNWNARRSHDLRAFLCIKKDKNAGEQFNKVIMRPLVRQLAKHPVLKAKAMFIAKPNSRNARYDWQSFASYEPDSSKFIKLLQGVVVITHNKMAYQERWDQLTNLQDTIPIDQERFVYIAPRTKGHKEEAVAFFKSRDYLVIDFATILDEDRALNYVAPTGKTTVISVPRPKNLGLVLLEETLGSQKRSFGHTNHLRADAPRSENYTHVIKPENLAGTYGKKFFPWGDNEASHIVRFFGSRVGVCVSEPQYLSQINKGKLDGKMLIVNEVCQKVLSSKGIRSYVENERGLKGHHGEFTTLLEMAKFSSVLANDFQLPKAASEDDLVYLYIFNSMKKDLSYGSVGSPPDGTWEKIVYDTNEAMDLWLPSPSFEVLNERIKASKVLHTLNLYKMCSDLRYLDKINPNYDIKVFIETSVLNALNIR